MNNRNINSFIDEIGNIDDDLLESALNYQKKKTILPFKKILSVAALLVVALGIGVCVKLASQNPPLLDKNNAAEWGDDALEKNESNFYEIDKDECISKDFDCLQSAEVSNAEGSLDGEQIPENDKDEVNSNLTDSTDCFEDPLNKNETTEDTSQEDSNNNHYGNIPSLDSYVEINDLNKLAYYSGWTILRKYGIHTQKTLSSISKKDGFKLLSNASADVSESDVSGEIPEDLKEYIYAYGINNITVSNVEYFQVYIEEKCFITRQVLAGNIEVMILNVSFDGVVFETMIVFKNQNRYFSCLLDSYSKKNNGDRIFTFKPTRIVSDFNIVNEPELSGYSFIVTFVNTESIPQIKFGYQERNIESVYTLNVSGHTYNTAKNVTVSNSVSDLNDALYKIYVDEVVSGEIPPNLPHKPESPEKPQEPDLPDTGEQAGEEVRPEILTYSHYAYFKEIFGSETGYLILRKGSDKNILLEMAYDCEEINDYMSYYPDGSLFILAWVKGSADFSLERFLNNDKKLTGNLEYVLFGESDRYTVKLYSFIYEIDEVEKITLKQVQYSVSSSVSFTTENEYDSLLMFGIENEDEFRISFMTNGRYELYKNEDKIYENAYKISEGFVCLNMEDDTIYAQIWPEKTFVLELEGWKRVFLLIQP